MLHSKFSSFHLIPINEGIVNGGKGSRPAASVEPMKLTTGHDDDGESGAGRVLLSLLESTDARGAVAVTRWYGGTPLGPARFRHIGSAGREALLKAGIAKK